MNKMNFWCKLIKSMQKIKNPEKKLKTRRTTEKKEEFRNNRKKSLANNVDVCVFECLSSITPFLRVA
jgi:hypothetical protein